jgi:hypothetical protein
MALLHKLRTNLSAGYNESVSASSAIVYAKEELHDLSCADVHTHTHTHIHTHDKDDVCIHDNQSCGESNPRPPAHDKHTHSSDHHSKRTPPVSPGKLQQHGGRKISRLDTERSYTHNVHRDVNSSAQEHVYSVDGGVDNGAERFVQKMGRLSARKAGWRVWSMRRWKMEKGVCVCVYVCMHACMYVCMYRLNGVCGA